MQNRIFPLALATIIGIVLGIALISKQTKDPILKEILAQQQTILNNQKALDAQIGGGGNGLATLIQKQQQLDTRLTSIESEWRGFKMAFQRGFGNAGPGAGAPQAPQEPQEDYTTVNEIPIGNTPVFGKKDAPVMIVEFMDFQCPFCGRFHPAAIEAAKAYPGKVSFMIKNFPLSFHPNARPAAKAALAAGEQGKYFEMAELLVKNQQVLSEDKYKEFAKELGLNEQKFWDDYKNKDAEWEKTIQADLELGSKVGVQGTPTYYINGRKTMARDLDSYKREIDQILKGE